MDSNHDGRIDAEQLLEVAKAVGMKVKSVHHAQALITKYGSRGWQKLSNVHDLDCIEEHSYSTGSGHSLC